MQIKENIKAPPHWPLCGFPAQMASNAENVSIWWRHHVKMYFAKRRPFCSGLNVSTSVTLLSHWSRDKITAVFQTAFSNAFSLIKISVFWLRFQWTMLSRVQLTILQLLVQIMVWRRTGDKPPSEPVVVEIGDAYMHLSASMSYQLNPTEQSLLKCEAQDKTSWKEKKLRTSFWQMSTILLFLMC